MSKLGIKPCQIMRGHTDRVRGVVHLPDGQPRRIVTCSNDGSLRLWNLESGAQIGESWRDEGDDAVAATIALSPKGKTIASGSSDGTVRLWDVETGKVASKWTGHSGWVQSVCWSPDGERVASGSRDGTARVWDVESGRSILGIKTGHESVHVVSYSPNARKIATGGYNKDGIKIWDANTGKWLSTIHEDWPVWTLAWTSDEKKLISGTAHGSIRIFDTATCQQIAILEGHTYIVYAITLSRNDRLLASTSFDGTVHLWNLDTNLLAGGSPLRHPNPADCAAFSADGTLLATAGGDQNAYVWDIHAILKAAGIEDLLFMPRTPKDELKLQKSLSDADATHRSGPNRLPRGFFDVPQDRVHPSASPCHHPHPSVHYHYDSLASSSGLRPRLLIDRMSSLFRRSQRNTDETTERQQRPMLSTSAHCSPRAVDVAAVRDKQALFVARRPERASDKAKRIGNPTFWTRVVLFVCCVSTQQTTDGHQ